MTQNQISYWNYVESNRHNLETEDLTGESNAISQQRNRQDYELGGSKLRQDYALGLMNVDVANRNATVNEKNSVTNQQNANTAYEQMRNSYKLGSDANAINRVNAQANISNAQSNWRNVSINQTNANSNRMNAYANQSNATTNRINSQTQQTQVANDYALGNTRNNIGWLTMTNANENTHRANEISQQQADTQSRKVDNDMTLGAWNNMNHSVETGGKLFKDIVPLFFIP